MNANRRQEPSQSFCTAAGLQHPLPEHLWHPEQFTFKAVTDLAQDIASYDVQLASYSELGMVSGATHYPERIATLLCTVRFSPENAVLIGEALRAASDRPAATFLFLRSSPAYKIDGDRANDSIARLKHMGFAVAQSNDIAENDLLGTLGLRGLSDVNVITTRHGYFDGGHPVADFAQNPTRKHAVIELADWAFSEQPAFANRRLMQATGNAAGLERYLDALPHAVLGAQGTLQGVSEQRRAQGHSGFVAAPHETPVYRV